MRCDIGGCVVKAGIGRVDLQVYLIQDCALTARPTPMAQACKNCSSLVIRATLTSPDLTYYLSASKCFSLLLSVRLM
jgi:hypothetical protein